jgi:hypothetical protein
MRRWLTAAALSLSLALMAAGPTPDEAALLAHGKRIAAAYPDRARPVLPGLAYSCLAGAALHDNGDRDGAGTVRASADLIMRKLRSKDGRPAGWSYEGSENCAGPGTSDSFNDGSCNAADTVYAFQTGLAATCLARASLVTGDARYARTAQAVLRRWGQAADAPCQGCINFQPGDSPNDQHRYIRNDNLLLGMAAAWTFAATGDAEMKRLARGVVRIESREAKAKNFGYFSIFDPKHRANPERESARLENHYPFIAKGLLDIGVLTGDAQARELGRRAMADYLACRGADCSRAPCTRWAGAGACWATPQALTPCFFRSDPRFAAACDHVLAHKPRFGAYQVWVVADGRSPRFRNAHR